MGLKKSRFCIVLLALFFNCQASFSQTKISGVNERKAGSGIQQLKLISGDYQLAYMMSPLSVTLDPQESALPVLDLYLLIGQSNMAGRGIIEAQDTLTDPNVYMLNKAGEWVPAKSPLHFDKAFAGTGMGLVFGKIIAENSEHKIGLIPCAVGGTSISIWRPGGYDKVTNTHPYDDAVGRVKIAMQNGRLKGILWHQGESDAAPERAAHYIQRFDSLLLNLQNDLSLDIHAIPVVVGELGRFYFDKSPHAKDFNVLLHQLEDSHQNIGVVSSEGLTHKGDTVHFDAASQRELGKRYAGEIVRLEKKILNQ